MKKKLIPEPTVQNVLPPNLDHVYFKDAPENPFRPLAQAFEPVNAWWLAEAALLAYADEAFAREQFGRAGLGKVELLSTAGSQCYLAEGRDFVIVAFRGTQVPKPGDTTGRARSLTETVTDFMADARFNFDESGHGGLVHAGFKGALDSIWPALHPRLLERAGRPVWMTGHSLGAALATLAAARLRTAQGLYVFGSPAVGDSAFAQTFHVNASRIVHHRDIVARVPPFGRRPDNTRGDYVHVGTLKYIDRDERLLDEAEGTDSLFGLAQAALRALIDLPRPARLARLIAVGRGPFDDHAPLYYALHSWNVYVDSRAQIA